ncbi:MAG: leucine-rich repeat domain-containing protein [Bacteroidales bacterium]|nr:leucine-rich repeat domain-containing protein [Bacteroidales bacterium]
MKIKIAALALLVTLTVCVTAQPVRIGNTDVYWEFLVHNNDTTLHIFGNGDIPGGTDLKWYSYTSSVKHVVTDEGITSVLGLQRFINLQTVSLPQSMKNIGSNAFGYDSCLTDINLPDSICNIGSSAFDRTHLTDTLHLPAFLTSLGSAAFRYTKIKHTDIPCNIDTIMVGVFQNTTLSSVNLPASVSVIYKHAFGETPLTSVRCLCITPPALQDTTVFGKVNRASCRLTVPSASVQIYKSTPIWQDFLIEAGDGYVVAVTSNNKASGIVQGVENRFYHAGETVTVRAITLNNGRFGGWKSNGQTISTNATLSFKVTQDTLITAVFEPKVPVTEVTDQHPMLTLYPNPSHDIIHIAAGVPVKSVTIYDLSGKSIRHITGHENIDISRLPAGIYFVKIQTDGFTCTKKLIKL